jgi:hypothetical protein
LLCAGCRGCFFCVGTCGEQEDSQDEGEKYFCVFHFYSFGFVDQAQISGLKNVEESDQAQAGGDARVIISQ